MKQRTILIYSILLLLFCIAFSLQVNGQVSANGDKNLRLPYKLIPVTHSVYNLLEYYESAGELDFLPIAKPYTKKEVVKYLQQLHNIGDLLDKEKKVISQYLNDFYRPVNGIILKEHTGEQTYLVIGAGGKYQGRIGAGENTTYSTSNIAEPFLAGDLGKNIGYFAGMGASIDRLAPDMFYQSYVKNGTVNFPHQNIGYAFHPYQFGYETMWHHVKVDASSQGGGPIQDVLTAGMIYHAELSGSWFNDALRFSFHNQQRSWGYAPDNLNLSERARRFPGIDLIIQPAPWLRYSFMVGSLFSYANQSSRYMSNVYDYDLGHVQKMITLHMLEFNPGEHFQIMATGGNIWTKRLELAYMMPFILPHLAQIDVGDHDNLSISLNFALKYPKFGKTWFSFFVDEFSFLDDDPWLKMPRNRYAWQLGWNTSLLNSIIPGTHTQISYTRVTPFVYTHYTENDLKPFATDRPLDLTYTHDEANLGFYLPPNSGEFKLKFSNLSVPDMGIYLDNRFIIHGTNDLAGEQCKIFGDVYRYQFGNVGKYPLLDFGKDGIYDYTWYSSLKVERKVRWVNYLNYFRIVGELGYSHTWWEANQSGIAPPPTNSMFSFSLGIIVDI